MFMKRLLYVLVIVLLVQLASYAQTVQYITHTIEKGETLSALGAKYKTTVGDIMRLNGMNSQSKLSIGQKVKIPLKGAKVPAQGTAAKPAPVAGKPVAQAPAPATGSPAVASPATAAPASSNAPITNATIHVVEKGETLYKISKTYGVTVDQLKQWNHLSSNNVAVGQQLTVGAANVTVVAQPSGAQPATTPVTTPADTAPQQQTAPPLQQQQQPAAKPPVTDTPATQPKPVAATPAEPMVPKEETYVDPAKVGSEGYFASLFGKEVQGRSLTDTTGTSMTFKTASGWTDKKYYILINNVSPGAIVKITVPGNSKVIYAKVLWNMNDMKENEGLAFRISNAAAEALGITDLKFQLKVAYFD